MNINAPAEEAPMLSKRFPKKFKFLLMPGVLIQSFMVNKRIE